MRARWPACPVRERIESAVAEEQTLEVLLHEAAPRDELERREALAQVEAALFQRPREAIRFGRYVLLAEQGSGGGGVVYAAYDPELDRKVAVKLVHTRSGRRGGESEARQRLLREAQAAAKLSHPNVVAVHDVGTYDEGRSPTRGRERGVYIVMELVEGASLRDWLRQQRPSWRDVLTTMIGVGRGLAAAHAQGLVHRDVKPGNIMVGGDGRARILDFGLARARALQPLSESGAAEHEPGTPAEDDRSDPVRASVLEDSLTQPGTVMGTPQYMAPEQHHGESTDARADQFSFCATVYEALYGQRAFEGADASELARAKTRGELRPPPARHEVPRFVHAALSRGLAAAPADRFASMDELLAALERDGPARVRRGLLFAGGVVSLGLAVGGWFSGSHASADPCADQAAELRGIWDDDSQAAVHEAFVATGSPYAAKVWSVVDIELDDYATRWVSLRTRACEQTLVEGRRDMVQMGRVMLCLDRRLMRLGGVTGVLASADTRTLERAPQMVAALPAPEPCLEGSPIGPASADLRAQGREEALAVERELARVDALIGAARLDDALALAESALERAEGLDDERLQAHALARMGEIDQRRSRYLVAETNLREALHRAERVRDEDLAIDVMLRLALGYGAFETRPNEALALARHAESRLWALGGDEARAAQAAHVIGRALETKGEHEQALAAQRTSLEIFERLRGRDDLLTMQALNNIGVLYDRMGRPELAHREYARVLSVRRERLGDAHPSVANSLGNVGAALTQLGRFDEAEAHLRAALKIYREAGDKRLWAWYSDELGLALRGSGRLAEALALHRRSLELRREVFGPEHRECGRSLTQIAATLMVLDRLDEAAAEARHAVMLLADLPDEAVLAEALTQEAAILRRTGAPEPARVRMDQALEILARTRGPEHPIVASAWIESGLLAVDEGDRARGRQQIERALALHERAGSNDAIRAPAWLALARAIEPTDPDRARELARDAVRALDHVPESPEHRAAQRWLEQHP
jgi:eukaryotic-like serine/threonine-protein kinase